MGDAWIDGRPVAFDAAAAAAAQLLNASRLPVIAGLGADVAGARAAIALAERLGGVIDHMHSDALLRDVAVMREAGMLTTTPSEAARRADIVVAVGEALFAREELAQRVLAPPNAPDIGEKTQRRVVALGVPRNRRPAQSDIQFVGQNPTELPVMLATLRARAAGRPVAGKPTRALDALATELRQARFGVALWTAAALETPVIEMVCGLVDDLNAATRFTGLALAPDDNAAGVLQVCGWTTGFPMRTGFARGRAEHDPWRHDAARLVASRETDCVLWISAYGAALPDWDVPMIALTAVADDDRTTPRVRIAVGRPGVDHDAVEHLAATDTLVHRVASNPSDTISVARALARIASALPDILHADAH